MRSRSSFGFFGAVLSAALTLCSPASIGAPIYDVTINSGATAYAVTGATVSVFDNCFAANGCMGDGSTLAIPSTITYTFALTAADVTAINNAAAGTVGQFILRAGRDIGIRQGQTPPEPDFIPATLEGTPIGTLFDDITSTCPAGERGTAYPADLVCGPNYHTDIAATDVLTIPLAVLQGATGLNSIDITLDPPDIIGRLIVFSAQLTIAQVPEPGTFALFGVAFAGLAFARRRTRH